MGNWGGGLTLSSTHVGGDWGVAEGHHNPIRCIKHSKEGATAARPLTTVSPRQPPIHNHYSVIKAGRGQSSALADGDKSLSWTFPWVLFQPKFFGLLAHLVLVPA